MAEREYDVAIVGGSLAGCTAATLLGQGERRVAVLESRVDPQAYKKLCTTVILPNAIPTLRRLGLDQMIEAAGGVRIGVSPGPAGAGSGCRSHRTGRGRSTGTTSGGRSWIR